MDIETTKKSNLEKVRMINEVPGYNPECYAVPYTDLNTGETRRRLPFMPLLAWFRLKYPEGKIACSVTKERGCFIAMAKIYCSYKDSPEQYISEATVSRTNCEDKPSVSPREWAQTAAISMALRNAGFGLQFDMVSDEFSAIAPDEFGISHTENGDTETDTSNYDTVDADKSSGYSDALSAVEDAVAAQTTGLTTPPKKEPSLDEKFDAACQVLCPIKKYEGRTLGELISIDPKALKWLAEKYEGNADTKNAAQLICEYSLQFG